MSGGAGEGEQRLQPEGLLKNRQEVKTDAALPAYCNPPNPCPIGYTAENGCLEEFKNTAAFSRRYQAEQDCMCDTEHMFDCPSPMISQLSNGNMDSPLNDLEFNRFFQQALQDTSGIQHKGLVAKKFNNDKKSVRTNPFLIGERLPVAAKKGFNAKEFY
ncbi:neuroendocrine protein 7B2-like [Atheta coriaria]